MANDTSVKKTLTTVDRSTKALTTSAEAIAKAAAELQSVVATANALAQDIEFKQSELSGLESAYAIKERELVAELSLKVKENSENVLNALLKERNARIQIAQADAAKQGVVVNAGK